MILKNKIQNYGLPRLHHPSLLCCPMLSRTRC
nr:MAG TPA: hypothetical protein [Caudoviricetes sp.]